MNFCSGVALVVELTSYVLVGSRVSYLSIFVQDLMVFYQDYLSFLVLDLEVSSQDYLSF